MHAPSDIRSDLLRLDAELASLAQNPDRLDRHRSRFLREIPPQVSSRHSSDDDTESESEPDEDTMRREELEMKRKEEHEASLPYYQFNAQTSQERERILEGLETRTAFVPLRTSFDSIAHDRVKKDWMEQGIWDNTWKCLAGCRWMHEESYQPPAPEKKVEVPPRRSMFSPPVLFATAERIANGETGSDKTEKHSAPPNDEQKRNTDASRPFYQFIHQISKEREWMQGPTARQDDLACPSADVNTRAYENVKASWIKRGIWKKEWGIMPGMVWKHELPMEELVEPLPERKEEITERKEPVPERKDARDGDLFTDMETDLKLYGCHSFSRI